MSPFADVDQQKAAVVDPRKAKQSTRKIARTSKSISHDFFIPWSPLPALLCTRWWPYCTLIMIDEGSDPHITWLDRTDVLISPHLWNKPFFSFRFLCPFPHPSPTNSFLIWSPFRAHFFSSLLLLLTTPHCFLYYPFRNSFLFFWNLRELYTTIRVLRIEMLISFSFFLFIPSSKFPGLVRTVHT